MRIGIGHAAPDRDAGRLHAAARALTDALLGAAGLRDGESAPVQGSGGERPGADSALDALSRAVRAVEGQNYQVVNVDLTAIGEGRGSERDAAADVEFRSELADRLHVSPGHVSVEEAASDDGAPGSAGPAGAVMAVALLDRMVPMDQVHSALRAGG